MAESLRGGLSLMLSGYIFCKTAIGGFEETPPPALYKRWVQFGLLSSHSRLHGSSSYRVPWIYGEDCSDVLRECVKRKISPMPYLLQEALHGHQSGVPLMRAMFLEYPYYLATYAIDSQYMFGSNLLVAPVFTEDGTVTFYVPRNAKDESKGKWASWFDYDKTYEPGQWYTGKHDFSSLPIPIRPGTVTAIRQKLKTPEDDALDGLEFIVNGILELGNRKIYIVNPKDAHEVLISIDVQKVIGNGANVVKVYSWDRICLNASPPFLHQSRWHQLRLAVCRNIRTLYYINVDLYRRYEIHESPSNSMLRRAEQATARLLVIDHPNAVNVAYVGNCWD